jgi:transposase
MPKRNYLSTPIKEAIVQAKEKGQTDRAVAHLFGINQATVSRIFKRHRECGDVSRAPKTGRPKKTSVWQERAINREIKREPNLNATDAVNYANQHFGVKISRWTGQRILRRRGLYDRRPARVPMAMTQKRHKKMPCQHLKRKFSVIFS